MRKILFLATLALSLAASAGERSRGEMRSIAQRYLPAASLVKGQGTFASAQVRCTLENKAYAVFEQEGTEAFVIVSKSDLAPEVIGYSQTAFSE
ncbi:MAG: Spi family protease inhibitor, partial [Bacteroidaceae bacterium]|nr:Spi family protease inhibitor [Bacteroidaceae bacterium]